MLVISMIPSVCHNMITLGNMGIVKQRLYIGLHARIVLNIWSATIKQFALTFIL